MDTIRFEQLNKGDIDPLSTLLKKNRKESIESHFHPFPLTSGSAADLLNNARNDLFFGLKQGKELLGMSMLRGFDEAYEIPSFGILIDGRHQGNGFGKRLMEWTLLWADQAGFSKVRLSVYSDNQRGVNLYEGLGFSISDRTKVSTSRIKYIMTRDCPTSKTTVFASLQAIRPKEELMQRIDQWNGCGLHNLECTYYPSEEPADKVIASLADRPSQFIIHNYFPPEDPELFVNLASPTQSEANKTIAYLEKAICRSAKIEASWLSFHAGFINDSNGRDEFGFTFPAASSEEKTAALERFIHRLKPLAQRAEALGIKLLIENNVCAPHNKDKLLLCTPGEFDAFFEKADHPNVFILLDTGHLNVSAQTYGFKTEEIERLSSKIIGMHLHENDGSADSHQPISAQSWPTQLARKIAPEFVSLEGRHDSIEHLQSAYLSVHQELNG